MKLSVVWLIRIFFLICSLVSGAEATSSNCEAAKLMGHPSLRGNNKFWDEFAKLSDPTDIDAVRDLLRKYAPDTLERPTTTPQLVKTETVALQVTPFISSIVEISHKAKKAMDRLTPQNRERFNEFMSIVNEKGLNELRNRPGSWNYKELKRNKKEHTVRLNDGSRVLFEVNGSDVKIIDIGVHITH